MEILQKQHSVDNQKQASGQAVNLGKVFLTMFVALLATAGFTALFAYLYYIGLGITKAVTPSGQWAYVVSKPENYGGFIAGWVVAFIGIIVCGILAGAISLKQQKSAKSKGVLIPFAIYVICMSYLIGAIVIFCPWEAVAISVGVSVLVFGILSLIGLLTKGNLRGLSVVIGGLCAGLLVISIINLILWFTNPAMANVFFWIFSYVFFAILMFATILDVKNIGEICKQGENSNNLIFYCAFRLYCDFISIFLEVLLFVARFSGNN